MVEEPVFHSEHFVFVEHLLVLINYCLDPLKELGHVQLKLVLEAPTDEPRFQDVQEVQVVEAPLQVRSEFVFLRFHQHGFGDSQVIPKLVQLLHAHPVAIMKFIDLPFHDPCLLH